MYNLNVMDSEELQKSVHAHEARNAALLKLFIDKNVDMRAPRDIDLHFWASGEASAASLAESLSRLGFEVPVRRPAPNADNGSVWNVEARVRQSIDLTMRREFITDLVRLADSHAGVFDGWGTLL